MPVCGTISKQGVMVYNAATTAQQCLNSSGYYVMTATEVQAAIAYPNLQPDPAWCSFFWSFGIVSVVSVYMVSKYVGEIVGFVRSAIR
jgi:hypothetical protein